MRIKQVELLGFKRFTDLRIVDLPESARLVVLAGPNGIGKSSLFDGLKTWHWVNGGAGMSWDESYGAKAGAEARSWPERVRVEMHHPLPEGPEDRKKMVYVRSAFRNEADFVVDGFGRMTSPLDQARITRLIDVDVSVSDNYRRLIMETIAGVFGTDLPDDATKAQLRDRLIGEVRQAMARVFGDLQFDGAGGLDGSGDTQGTFYFTKGTAAGFLYKNLSAGEKAVFDLVLDEVAKRRYFDDTIWCIDEPEAHLNTRVQARLLDVLVDLLPANCQLLLASHSIGFMRRAWEMAQQDSGSVAFVDLAGHDFDQPVVIAPVHPSRDFWARTLDVALGDISALMAPERVVLCEGKPLGTGTSRNAEFDAACYRTIFAAEYPGTDFLSVGSSADVRADRLEVGRAIQTLTSGVALIRIVDRDLFNKEEVANLLATGTRVLSRRHIEAYLLDDEVIHALCAKVEAPEKAQAIIDVRDAVLRDGRGDTDDVKRAAGQTYTAIRSALALTGSGSDFRAFAKTSLAPLLTPGMTVYDDLKADIFGPAPAAAAGVREA